MGKPYSQYGAKQTVSMFQESDKQLYSCEVTRDSTVVKTFPFNLPFKGQTESSKVKPVALKYEMLTFQQQKMCSGHVSTPLPTSPAIPATTTRWSEDNGRHSKVTQQDSLFKFNF